MVANHLPFPVHRHPWHKTAHGLHQVGCAAHQALGATIAHNGMARQETETSRKPGMSTRFFLIQKMNVKFVSSAGEIICISSFEVH